MAQMLAKLGSYASQNKEKHLLIERALKFLSICAQDSPSILLLVNPVPTNGDILDSTLVGSATTMEDREALVTRRVLAGYLPVACLARDESPTPNWRATIDPTIVPRGCRDEFVAFAQIEADITIAGFKGKISKNDYWNTAVPWEHTIYPGLPLSRKAGTIRIEVNLGDRTMTVVWTMADKFSQKSCEELMLTGDETQDINCVARHAIEGLRRCDPPMRCVDGDSIEVWKVVTEVERTLLFTEEVNVAADAVSNESANVQRAKTS